MRARRHRVVTEPGALAQLERLLEDLAGGVVVLLLVLRDALAVELDDLRDDVLVILGIGARGAGRAEPGREERGGG